MLLDLVEMAKSHTGVNLSNTFVTILQNFGIDEKVSVANTGSQRPLTGDAYCRS